jgi:hypothetical protein
MQSVSKARRVVGAAAVVLLFTGLIAAAHFGGSHGGAAPSPRDGIVATPDLKPRFYPAQAWTNKGLAVFGGQDRLSNPITYLSDGALVDPKSGSTTEVAPPPLGAIFEPALAADANTWLLVGPQCEKVIQPEGGEAPGCSDGEYVAATYDIGSGKWTAVTVPDALATYRAFSSGEYRITRVLGVTTDHRVVLALGAPLHEEFWTFDLETTAWTQLPSSPVRAEDYCLAADHLAVVTAQYSYKGTTLPDSPFRAQKPGEVIGGGPDDGYVDAAVAELDLRTGIWAESQPLIDVKFLAGTTPKLDCMADNVLVTDRVDQSRAHELNISTLSWADVSAPPRQPPRGARIWDGSELVFMPDPGEVGQAGLAFSPSANSWRDLVDFPEVTTGAIWNGSSIVGYSMPLPRSIQKVDAPPDTLPAESGVFSYDIH